MDCIILAGGFGTRVRPITNDKIPKIMIPINGEPFVDYLINVLHSQGVRRIVFAAGFKAHKLEQYLSATYTSSYVRVVKEDTPLDTAGAVLNVLNHPYYTVDTNPFLVINGDCLVLPSNEFDSYEDIYYSELHDKPVCAMFTCFMEHDGRYGSLVLGDYHPLGYEYIKGFENNRAGGSWINCGYYIMRKEMFDAYRDGRSKHAYRVKKLSMEKDVFPRFLESGNVIQPIYIQEKQFLEIGTPEALMAVSRRLKELKEF